MDENINCFACGAANPMGLGLRFAPAGEGVEAAYSPLPWHQGYDGVVHGGILATMLDEAMAHALLARGIEAVTVKLAVRFATPLRIGEAASLSGSMKVDRGRLIVAGSEIRVGGAVVAEAEGVFAVRRRG